MNMKGKKTYIIAIVAALYQVAYSQGIIPVDAETHAMILGLFASAGAVTLRQGVSNSGPKPPEMPGS